MKRRGMSRSQRSSSSPGKTTCSPYTLLYVALLLFIIFVLIPVLNKRAELRELEHRKNAENLFLDMDPTGKACMHVLVTGGAGFLGSHLSEELVKSGHCVVALDDLSSGNRENLQFIQLSPRFRFLQADIREPLQLHRVHQIYHLAGPASPAHYDRARVKTSTSIYQGTLNMLELASKQGARLLFTSTSEVYGDPEQHPQKEEYWGHTNPVGPRSCYHESKRAAESLITAYEEEQGTDVRIARLFNTFGPRMAPHDGRVVRTFLDQALHNQNITVYGDGSQTRSLCYVDDMIEAVILLMNHDGHNIGPVNLGNNREITVLQLAKKIIRLTDSNSTIVHLSPIQEDPGRRQPDLTKASKLLGWTPKISLERGLEKMIYSLRLPSIQAA